MWLLVVACTARAPIRLEGAYNYDGGVALVLVGVTTARDGAKAGQKQSIASFIRMCRVCDAMD